MGVAGAFTAFLLERFGGPAYMRVYRRLQFADGAGLVSRALEAELGASLAELAEEFDATRRACPPLAFKRKLIECSAPELAWDGERLAAFRTLACAQDDVVVAPEAVREFMVRSPDHGHVVLIFGVCDPLRGEELPPFSETDETVERLVVTGPVELAFPLHTEALARYFATRAG